MLTRNELGREHTWRWLRQRACAIRGSDRPRQPAPRSPPARSNTVSCPTAPSNWVPRFQQLKSHNNYVHETHRRNSHTFTTSRKTKYVYDVKPRLDWSVLKPCSCSCPFHLIKYAVGTWQPSIELSLCHNFPENSWQDIDITVITVMYVLCPRRPEFKRVNVLIEQDLFSRQEQNLTTRFSLVPLYSLNTYSAEYHAISATDVSMRPTMNM